MHIGNKINTLLGMVYAIMGMANNMMIQVSFPPVSAAFLLFNIHAMTHASVQNGRV